MYFLDLHCIYTCIFQIHTCINTCIHLNNQKLKVFMYSYMHFHKNVDQNSPKLNSPKINDPLDTRSQVKIPWSSRYKISVSCVRCDPLVHGQPYVWSDDPLDTRSISPVKIHDPLDTRSRIHMFSEDPFGTRSQVKIRWSSRYKIPISCC